MCPPKSVYLNSTYKQGTQFPRWPPDVLTSYMPLWSPLPEWTGLAYIIKRIFQKWWHLTSKTKSQETTQFALAFPWTICSWGSQLPCHEVFKQHYGQSLTVRNEDPLPTTDTNLPDMYLSPFRAQSQVLLKLPEDCSLVRNPEPKPM